jgi:integrase/recombinase XerD
MPRRKEGARVLGPYPKKRGGIITGWRVCSYDGAGTPRWRTLESRDEAEAYIQSLRKTISAQDSVGEAVGMYMEYMLETKGNKPRSVATTVGRLEAWFADDEQSLSTLTPRALQQRYLERQGEVSSADTHRNELAEVKTFFKWCVKQGLLPANPAADVEPVGKRQAGPGKDKLRIDEARKWLTVASELAVAEPGATAAMVSLLMGLRATEIIERTARDVDDDGRLLWIPCSKTPNGVRAVDIPDLWGLRARMIELKGKAETPWSLLFGHHWRDWPRENVQRICRLAEVPRVTAHGMRALWGELAIESGAVAELVARKLGHGNVNVNRKSYAGEQAFKRAEGRRALAVLKGGKK